LVGIEKQLIEGSVVVIEKVRIRIRIRSLPIATGEYNGR